MFQICSGLSDGILSMTEPRSLPSVAHNLHDTRQSAIQDRMKPKLGRDARKLGVPTGKSILTKKSKITSTSIQMPKVT